MAMNVSAAAQQCLEEWIGRGTWHGLHPADTARFLRFVRALAQCNEEAIDEPELRELILEQVMDRGDWTVEDAKSQILKGRYANRAQEIISYHLANGDQIHGLSLVGLADEEVAE